MSEDDKLDRFMEESSENEFFTFTDNIRVAAIAKKAISIYDPEELHTYLSGINEDDMNELVEVLGKRRESLILQTFVSGGILLMALFFFAGITKVVIASGASLFIAWRCLSIFQFMKQMERIKS